jgi:hypothetical protein
MYGIHSSPVSTVVQTRYISSVFIVASFAVSASGEYAQIELGG